MKRRTFNQADASETSKTITNRHPFNALTINTMAKPNSKVQNKSKNLIKNGVKKQTHDLTRNATDITKKSTNTVTSKSTHNNKKKQQTLKINAGHVRSKRLLNKMSSRIPDGNSISPVIKTTVRQKKKLEEKQTSKNNLKTTRLSNNMSTNKNDYLSTSTTNLSNVKVNKNTILNSKLKEQSNKNLNISKENSPTKTKTKSLKGVKNLKVSAVTNFKTNDDIHIKTRNSPARPKRNILKLTSPVELCKRKTRSSTSKINESHKKDVYEFVIDRNEQRDLKKKHTRKRHLYLSDSSDDTDNSMSEILKRLRLKERKDRLKLIRKEKNAETMNILYNNKKIIPENIKRKDKEKNIVSVSKNKRSQENVNPIKESVQDIENDFDFQDLNDDGEINLEQLKTSNLDQKKKVSTPEEIVQSFCDDFEVETSQSKPTLNVSNIIMRQASNISLSPWRLDLSTIRRYPNRSSGKNQSSLVNRNQSVIMEKKTEKLVKQFEKNITQKSILNYITGTEKIADETDPRTLFFCESLILSPKKIISQSTPFPKKNILKDSDWNISKISPNKENTPKSPLIRKHIFKSPDCITDKENLNINASITPHTRRSILKTQNTNNISPNKENTNLNYKSPINAKHNKSDTCFGFTWDEDNDDFMSYSKIIPPQNVSVKETKKKLHIEIQTDKDHLTIEDSGSKSPVGSDISIPLFQENKISPKLKKKYRVSYDRKYPKRRRHIFVSSDKDDSDDEVHVVKKRKDVLTKAEQKKIDELASKYNSMFDEIETHELEIE